MGLGSLVKAASAGPPSIKGTLRSFKRSEQVPYLTEDGWIRASGFAMLCPREEVLCARERLTRVREIETDLLLIFEHGNGLHDRLQNSILPGVGVLRGKWICLGCGTMQGGPPPKDCSVNTDWAIPRPEKCEKCESTEFRFFEVEYYNYELKLRGHTDGYLVLPGMSSIGVLEAKSIKPGWQIKNVPKMEHAVQLQQYLLLTGLQWGIILYWIKGENGTAAFVEHFVERDEGTLDSIRKTILGIRSGITGGPLPEPVCATATCPRASGCVVAEQCFATIEKPEEEEDDLPF